MLLRASAPKLYPAWGKLCGVDIPFKKPGATPN